MLAGRQTTVEAVRKAHPIVLEPEATMAAKTARSRWPSWTIARADSSL